MPEVRISNLFKRFGRTVATDHINLRVNDKEFFTLLGPSGCGKTTCLRLLAGFIKPDEGEIYIGDRLVASAEKGIHLPPEKRRIGMVFQNYALWPHMKVIDNVMFGLKTKKVPREEAEERALNALDLVRLKEMSHRYPHELSGGQQQRVALARAIVIEPDVLLLDEPLSNLDARLRDTLRFELKDLHNKLGITTIYVTHDQAEAIVMSDTICAMFEGEIIQLSSPQELYEKPASRSVAEFMGMCNFIDGEVETDSEGRKVVIPGNCKIGLEIPNGIGDGTLCCISIRPEDVHIYPATINKKENLLQGVVLSKVYTGRYMDYRVSVDDIIFRVHCSCDVNFSVGETVYLSLDSQKVTLLPKKNQNLNNRTKVS